MVLKGWDIKSVKLIERGVSAYCPGLGVPLHRIWDAVCAQELRTEKACHQREHLVRLKLYVSVVLRFHSGHRRFLLRLVRRVRGR